jgi:predicted O-methyltransferase YrrM
MVTLNDIMALKQEALHTHPYPDVRWPPSPYYRFLALVLKKLNGKLAIELGICGGGASLNMAIMNPHAKVIGIDVVKLPQVSGVEQLCPNFTFKLGDSVGLAPTIIAEYGNPDLIFIDTDHTYEQTLKEYSAWLPLMRKGGVMCFDDLYRPGVQRFWGELSGTKTEYRALHELHIGGEPTDGGFGVAIV